MVDPLSVRKVSNKFYLAWCNMRRRCGGNSYTNEYARYIEKGISFCDRWKSFDNFYMDMRHGYREGLSLDRIDNDKGYSPENCRWATAKEQANNTSRNKVFTINGVSKTLAQWIETSNMKRSTVTQRLYTYGWNIEDALTLPLSSRPLAKKEG